ASARRCGPRRRESPPPQRHQRHPHPLEESHAGEHPRQAGAAARISQGRKVHRMRSAREIELDANVKRIHAMKRIIADNGLTDLLDREYEKIDEEAIAELRAGTEMLVRVHRAYAQFHREL